MMIPDGFIAETMTRLVALFEAELDRLNELDAQLGDGDHGLSMLTGLRAARDIAHTDHGLSLPDFLRQAATGFNEAAGSTIGILMMSAMRAAGESVHGKPDLSGSDAAIMLDAAVKAIMKRGKTDLGQKTIIDSLAPAVDSLSASARNGASAVETADAAALAAREGAESTKPMSSTIGRARWFAERSVGIMDPGAWSGYLLVKTLGDCVVGRVA
jgi:dihydroxyacetone kinase